MRHNSPQNWSRGGENLLVILEIFKRDLLQYLLLVSFFTQPASPFSRIILQMNNTFAFVLASSEDIFQHKNNGGLVRKRKIHVTIVTCKSSPVSPTNFHPHVIIVKIFVTPCHTIRLSFLLSILRTHLVKFTCGKIKKYDQSRESHRSGKMYLIGYWIS